jgi:hypothetical protein
LLAFMCLLAKRARHVLLGTATPIQTDTAELWDLLDVLNRQGEFVLGRLMSRWRSAENALPLVTGREFVEDEEAAWDLLRNPLPPAASTPCSITSATSCASRRATSLRAGPRPS